MQKAIPSIEDLKSLISNCQDASSSSFLNQWSDIDECQWDSIPDDQVAQYRQLAKVTVSEEREPVSPPVVI